VLVHRVINLDEKFESEKELIAQQQIVTERNK